MNISDYQSEWIDALEDPEARMEYETESLFFACTEAILSAIEKTGLTIKEAAARAGLKAPSVSRSLSGGHNMTLRTLARLAFAAQCRVEIELEPLVDVKADFNRYSAPVDNCTVPFLPIDRESLVGGTYGSSTIDDDNYNIAA